MSITRVEEVLQQINALNPEEQRSLVEYLNEQAKKDAEVAAMNVVAAATAHDEPDPLRRQEYEWLRQHRDEYAGQYVALSGNQLVAHAATLEELRPLVLQSGVYRPLYVRIEAADEPPFGGW